MSMRNISILRALAPSARTRLPSRSLPRFAPRTYATQDDAKPTTSGKPRPGQRPAGLEGLFGDPAPSGAGTTGPGAPSGPDLHPPTPPGTEHPSEPSPGKRPDVGLPGLEGEDGAPSFKERRKKLSESTGQGTKTAFGGGGGGGGGSGGGMPGGGFGLTPNQLMWAIIG